MRWYSARNIALKAGRSRGGFSGVAATRYSLVQTEPPACRALRLRREGAYIRLLERTLVGPADRFLRGRVDEGFPRPPVHHVAFLTVGCALFLADFEVSLRLV